MILYFTRFGIFVFLIFVSYIFPQQIFIEPELGFHIPFEETFLSFTDTNRQNYEQNFKDKYSPRIGFNIGLISRTNVRHKFVYNIMIADQNNLISSTGYGVDESKYFKESKWGIRLGGQFLIRNRFKNIENLVWTGIGTNIQGGLVKRLSNSTEIFMGIGYYAIKLVLDNIDGKKRQDLNIKKKNSTAVLEGINFIINFSFIFPGYLEFEDSGQTP